MNVDGTIRAPGGPPGHRCRRRTAGGGGITVASRSLLHASRTVSVLTSLTVALSGLTALLVRSPAHAATTPLASIVLQGTVRDFEHLPLLHSSNYNPDFQNACCGDDHNITTSQLGADGAPSTPANVPTYDRIRGQRDGGRACRGEARVRLADVVPRRRAGRASQHPGQADERVRGC